jgi:hypothetical protein
MAINGQVSPRFSRQAIATALLVLASVLIALALFLAGAIWRARMTSGSVSVTKEVLQPRPAL